ncbi:hypothetical protein BC828DRAFT_403377 [Blastocladiella britannica]|nr:hypothetical protein BC828DRAFT_403377 [Blastocladiella britannica]
MNNNDTRLVRAILTPHFGPQVADVATALAGKGRQSQRQLARSSGQPAPLVRAALVVLLQHGLAAHYTAQNGSSDTTYYSLLMDRVRWRVRVPRYVRAAERMFADHGRLIAREMAVHGRRSLRQILDGTTITTSSGSPPVAAAAADRERIRNTFIQMVHDLYLAPATADSGVSALDANLTDYTAQVKALGVMPSVKQIKDLNARRDRLAEEALNNFQVVGLKRKPGVTSSEYRDKAHKSWDVDPDMPYALHHAQFHRQFTFDAMRATAATKINEVARKVLGSVIRLASDAGNAAAVTGARSSPYIQAISPAQVLRDCNVKDYQLQFGQYPATALDKVTDYMVQLSRIHLLHFDPTTSTATLPTPAEYRSVARRTHTVSYVTARYGTSAARIVRALHHRGKLEEKQIAAACMLPAPLARSQCAAMLSQGIVDLLPVHKTADRHPGRSIYVYEVNDASVVRATRAALELAVCNALDRVSVATASAEAALLRLEHARVAGKRWESSSVSGPVSAAGATAPTAVDGAESAEGAVEEAERLRIKRVEAVRTLHVTTLRLDEDWLLFEDN